MTLAFVLALRLDAAKAASPFVGSGIATNARGTSMENPKRPFWYGS
jgi:hypothetical protein